LSFEGTEKKLPLNSTNARQLEEAHGSDYKNWFSSKHLDELVEELVTVPFFRYELNGRNISGGEYGFYHDNS
jgi:hypothetical protein